MKLVFAFNIVVYAAQNSNNKVSVCEGQCSDPLATCTEGGENGFVCNCPLGYSWITDMSGWNGYCEDIDECIEGNGGHETCNWAGMAYVCVNLIGSFTCGCNNGFELNTDTTECQDIDECAAGTSDCEYGCVNLYGSFECPGPLNPCQGQCNGAICEVSNNLYDYECICLEGYTWDFDACIDIDECATGGVGADICNAGAVCENTIGSFHCGCAASENHGKI